MPITTNFDQIPAEEIMTKDFPVIGIEKSVGDAYDLLVESKVDCLPIIQDGKTVRMLTRNNLEIMRSIFFDAPGLEDRQARVMCLALSNLNQTQKLISALPKDTLKSVAELMTQNNIHSIPILNENSEFQGMITSLQILTLATTTAEAAAAPTPEVASTPETPPAEAEAK